MLPRFLLSLPLLILACTELPETPEGPRQGPPGAGSGGGDGGGGSGAEDTGEGDEDGSDGSDGGNEDTGDPLDEVDPTESGEVCYPGAALDWTACLVLVDWDPAWGADYEYPDPLDGSDQYLAPVRFVDLDAEDPALYLAPNFVLDEFMQAWKGRFGLIQPHAVEYAQAIRDATGGPLTINSGYRSVSYNAGVGGATWSRHLYGDGLDLASSVASLDEVADLCEDLGAGYIGMYTSHVHCDWRDDPLAGAFFPVGTAAAPSGPPAPPELRAELAEHPVDVGVLVAPAEGFDEGEPRRRWSSWDAEGLLIERVDATSYRPAPGARRVTVEVGGPQGLLLESPWP